MEISPQRVSDEGWVIDPGPEGGEIVAEAEHDGRSGGSFSARKHEQVAREPRSYTGHYLAPLLGGHAPEVVDTPKGKKRRAASVWEREAAE